MWKLVKLQNAGTLTLVLCGRLEASQLSELRRILKEDANNNVVLNLEAVRLVDQEVVQFLSDCEATGEDRHRSNGRAVPLGHLHRRGQMDRLPSQTDAQTRLSQVVGSL